MEVPYPILRRSARRRAHGRSPNFPQGSGHGRRPSRVDSRPGWPDIRSFGPVAGICTASHGDGPSSGLRASSTEISGSELGGAET